MRTARALVASMGLSLLAPAAGLGLEVHVDVYNDPAPGSCEPGSCSLREAVILAHSIAVERIVLSAGTYTLTRNVNSVEDDSPVDNDLDITFDQEIVGAGASMTTIDATNFRVFDVHENLGQQGDVTLRLSGVSLQGGAAAFANDGYAAMVNSGGELILDDCEIRNGFSDPGFGAGAITLLGGAMTAKRTTFADNNHTGLLATSGGTASLENVTFSGNGATTNDAQIWALAGQVTCTHCTIVGAGTVPALRVGLSTNGGSITLVNSLLIGSCLVSGPGVILSSGGNVESPGHECGAVLASDDDDVVALDIGLGSLLDNGGPTRTRDVANASTPVSHGLVANCPSTDQRGATRSFGHNCAAGAFEPRPRPPTPLFVDGFEQASAGVPHAWSAKLP